MAPISSEIDPKNDCRLAGRKPSRPRPEGEGEGAARQVRVHSLEIRGGQGPLIQGLVPATPGDCTGVPGTARAKACEGVAMTRAPRLVLVGVIPCTLTYQKRGKAINRSFGVLQGRGGSWQLTCTAMCRCRPSQHSPHSANPASCVCRGR